MAEYPAGLRGTRWMGCPGCGFRTFDVVAVIEGRVALLCLDCDRVWMVTPRVI
jgi:hypothetical protein